MIKAFIQDLVILITKLIFKIIFRLETEGIEKIPQNTPLIIISNHHSYFDPAVLMVSSHRKIHFVAKKELFYNPFTFFFVKLFDSIPVDRENPKPSTFKTVLKYLSENKVVGIFPEGTRVKDPKKFGQAEEGINLILSKFKCPILITYIDGTYQWYKKFKIRVLFKELVKWEELEKIPEKERVKLLMRKVYENN